MHHRLFLSVIRFCCFSSFLVICTELFFIFLSHGKKKCFLFLAFFFCVGTDESSFTFFILLLEKCIAQFCHIRVSECVVCTPQRLHPAMRAKASVCYGLCSVIHNNICFLLFLLSFLFCGSYLISVNQNARISLFVSSGCKVNSERFSVASPSTPISIVLFENINQ